MQPSGSFKQSLLEHMLACLRAGGLPTTKMTVLERKRAIKLSADAAMALARGGSNWSRAIIANLDLHEGATAGVLAKGGADVRVQKLSHSSRIIRRSRKILRRRGRGAARGGGNTGVLGHHGVRRSMRMRMTRTQVLKALVPGADSLKDDMSLLGEALDYVVSLQAQVDVLQRLTTAVESLNGGGRELTTRSGCHTFSF